MRLRVRGAGRVQNKGKLFVLPRNGVYVHRMVGASGSSLQLILVILRAVGISAQNCFEQCSPLTPPRKAVKCNSSDGHLSGQQGGSLLTASMGRDRGGEIGQNIDALKITGFG